MGEARPRAILALEDGTTFEGVGFGALGERAGEVVFNTGLTGYPEILTDPSYKGQIVVMTYPHIGNYGITAQDFESWQPHVEGFVVREFSPLASNWRAETTLDAFLGQHGIVGISEVDTRALTRHLRQAGAMRGVISTVDNDSQVVVGKALAAAEMKGRDLVQVVTTESSFEWPATPRPDLWGGDAVGEARPVLHVVAYDYGIKHNLLRELAWRDCRVTVVPATLPAADVLALRPDGVFLSNGPGDPAALDYAVSNVRDLLGRVPLFGVCLGHQLMGLAVGGQTYKLKFGHHGVNHPVKSLLTGQVEITSQNHGFAVDAASLPGEVEVTHLNLNDGTVEGLRHREAAAFSVQYHPEAAPGPRDAEYLFDEFRQLMEVGG
ncbi:MAG: glutamine-hydrolyzing carbamoyl-phosphate synthase small subunit [Anaerolineae bacterium]|nr:glutamine-hydrolyzing carbamoyl-phosphate synthase small subunit [Anaerolineae bacterium]